LFGIAKTHNVWGILFVHCDAAELHVITSGKNKGLHVIQYSSCDIMNLLIGLSAREETHKPFDKIMALK
jgi:hypothetical protein